MAGQADCTQITDLCRVQDSIYGYYPNLGANVFFCVFFGIALVAHLFLGYRYKTWTYTIALSLGCLTECIGYVGRILLHSNPYDNAGFQIQICCLIIAPAFIAAGIYLTLKHLVLTFGQEHSWLPAKYYTWVFIAVDILSLALQGAGGGTAASANTDSMRNIGTDLMLAGIGLQAGTLFIFSILVIDYFIRVSRHWSTVPSSAKALLRTSTFRLFAVGASLAVVLTFIRCVYRIPELSGGWRNDIMQNELDFIVLDSVMVAGATIALSIFHPGFCFPRLSATWADKSETVEAKVQDSASEGSLAEGKQA